MRQSSKTALGGIISALSVLLMFLTAVIPFMTYAVPLIAGTLLVLMVREVGSGWAFAVYAAVSLLAVFIIPDKEAATFYVAFFGYYPIIKPHIEKRLPKALQWIIKYLIFNLACVAGVALTIYVFGIPFDETGKLGKYGVYIALALANVTFLFYDILLDKLIYLYDKRWRKSFLRIFK